MANLPSPNGDNGRDAGGRFVAGNGGGPGNPNARKTAAFRQIFLECVSDDDMREVVAKLIEMSKEGELQAVKILLERLLGRPVPSVELPEPEEATEYRVAGKTPEQVRTEIIDTISALLPYKSNQEQ